jgi:hypothetical protein
MSTIQILENSIQPYAWGSHTAIAQLQGRPSSESPEAELWIGAHPRAPSRLAGEERNLLDWIQAQPDRTLGPESRTRFGDGLPFLLKVLAAEQALSLQAHPSRAQAREGFAQEERARVPMEDPRRSYKDANHKPELICALEPFHALCGFRPLADSLALLESLELVDLLPAYAALRERKASRALRSCCEQLWQLDQAQRDEALDALRTSVHRALDQGSRTHEAMLHDLLFVAEQLPRAMPDCSSCRFLHHVVLCSQAKLSSSPRAACIATCTGSASRSWPTPTTCYAAASPPSTSTSPSSCARSASSRSKLRKIAPADVRWSPLRLRTRRRGVRPERCSTSKVAESWRRAPARAGAADLHRRRVHACMSKASPSCSSIALGSSAFVPAALHESTPSAVAGRLFVAHLGAGPSVTASRF